MLTNFRFKTNSKFLDSKILKLLDSNILGSKLPQIKYLIKLKIFHFNWLSQLKVISKNTTQV